MKLEFFSNPDELAIVKEIKLWSTDVLEKPCAYFNDLPPCPYARKAWVDDKVAIIFKHHDSYQPLYSCISQFDDKFDLAIIIDLANDKEPEVFHEYLDSLNDVISSGTFIDKDIWLMGFHHDDEVSEAAEETAIEPLTETEYSMIFVQRLSKLQESADRLGKKGYYDSYVGEYNAAEIFNRREKLNRRLKDGFKTS
tara:strand:+ start:64 stop:651 length:588 start_codon:yes stop_codon:yes gene_type:complete